GGRSLKRRKNISTSSETGKTGRHECAVCRKCFKSPAELRRHERVHTGEKAYESFVDAGDLKRHMRTHTGEKPFECDFCGKQFTWSSAVPKHKKRVHAAAKSAHP
ncbi:unnamed protein product, partial [Cyprideis torosa]